MKIFDDFMVPKDSAGTDAESSRRLMIHHNSFLFCRSVVRFCKEHIDKVSAAVADGSYSGKNSEEELEFCRAMMAAADKGMHDHERHNDFYREMYHWVSKIMEEKERRKWQAVREAEKKEEEAIRKHLEAGRNAADCSQG